MFNIILGSLLSFFLTSFYSLHFQDINGNQVNMISFQGKKILLVNIATGSPKVGQLAGLEQLKQQYGDSLVIIAFPSNSFANEPRSNSEILQFCQTGYNTTFIIASKTAVSGTGTHPVFEWLANKTANGDVDLPVNTDFQKVLIGKNGVIQAYFSSKLEPNHPKIIEAITATY